MINNTSFTGLHPVSACYTINKCLY